MSDSKTIHIEPPKRERKKRSEPTVKKSARAKKAEAVVADSELVPIQSTAETPITLTTTPPPYTILSFDIGIVNLAYCLMEVNSEVSTKDDKSQNKKLCILDWNVLDISGNASCCLCTKRSYNYIVLNPSTTLYYCSTHTKNYAKKHYSAKEVHKITSIGTKNLDELGAELYRRLEGITSFRRKIDCVLFENQPAFKNPKMKSIQMILYSYFLLKRTLGDPVMSVGELRFYIAKRKLEIKGVGVDASFFNKKEYGDRKVLGKIIAKTILDKIGDQSNLARLCEFKKQDDMCDSFIQGVEYLQSTGISMF